MRQPAATITDTAARELAEFLADHREAAGLSQQALAAALGVSAGYVAHIERGRRQVADDKVDRLADVLGFDLSAARRFERLRQQVRVDALRRNLAEAEERLAELVARERQ